MAGVLGGCCPSRDPSFYNCLPPLGAHRSLRGPGYFQMPPHHCLTVEILTISVGSGRADDPESAGRFRRGLRGPQKKRLPHSSQEAEISHPPFFCEQMEIGGLTGVVQTFLQAHRGQTIITLIPRKAQHRGVERHPGLPTCPRDSPGTIIHMSPLLSEHLTPAFCFLKQNIF